MVHPVKRKKNLIIIIETILLIVYTLVMANAKNVKKDSQKQQMENAKRILYTVLYLMVIHALNAKAIKN